MDKVKSTTEVKSSYNFNEFATVVKRMIATNKNAYVTNPTRGSGYEISYTEAAAKETIANGVLDDLIKLSQYYWYSSGLYRNFIMYYSTMSTFDTFLTPKTKGSPKNLNNKKLEDKFFKALNFIDGIDVPLEFARITCLMIINGAYYGLFRDYGDRNLMFQDLPIQYCRTRFKDSNKLNLLEFDLSYFKTTITDKTLREEALKDFPDFITSAYREYETDVKKRWVTISSEDGGIAFFYQDQKPMLITSIPAIIKLDSYRQLEEDTDKQNLNKILTQKIPLDKDSNEPVFELPEIQSMHEGIVGMLANTPNVDVLTTLAEVDIHSLQDTRQVLKDNLEKIERSVYIDAGISKQIFNAEGGIALATSIINDEAILLDILKMYNTFLNFHINSRFEDNKFFWDCQILPITHYNKDKMREVYLKNAQYGYSKFLPGIAGGIKQSSLIGVTILEEDILGLTEKLVPLSSSHTQTDESDATGAPKKPITEVKEKTVENEENL